MWEQVEQALNDSMLRMMTRLANLLPGVLALTVAVLISCVFAWLVAFGLRRFLRSIQFDQRLADWGFGSVSEYSPSRSPSILVIRVVAGCIVLIGFFVGVTSFDAEVTSEFVEYSMHYLPNVLAAVLIVLGGHIAARLLARNVLIGAVNLNLQYARLLSMGVKWLVLTLAVTMALEHLSIGGTTVYLAFGILFGGIVLALALAVGIGSKDLVSRSLERETRRPMEEIEEPFRHL